MAPRGRQWLAPAATGGPLARLVLLAALIRTIAHLSHIGRQSSHDLAFSTAAGAQQWRAASLRGGRASASQLPMRASRYEAPRDLTPPMFGAEKSESGLAWQVLQEGEGDLPTSPSNTAIVHYTGWKSADGKMFDSSYMTGAPRDFVISGLIEGWAEGLMMMRPGEKRRLWIPGELAYGKMGQDASLPYGDLVFDVELIELKDPGADIVKFFGGFFLVLCLLTIGITLTMEVPERPEYDNEPLISFRPKPGNGKYDNRALLEEKGMIG